MRAHADIIATRWELLRSVEENGRIEGKKYINLPRDWHYIHLLFNSGRLFLDLESIISISEFYYDNDLYVRESSDGRMVDPAMPVQFSKSIVDMAGHVHESEYLIESVLKSLELTAEDADFDIDSKYEKWARNALTRIRKLAEFTKKHLHAHLWAIWVNESLSQASQIHYVIKNWEQYEYDVDIVYPYIAHPPLIVATIGCTALIEEVGGYYLNKFTDKCVDPDNTNSREILRDLEREYSRADEYRLEEIENQVVEARNDLSHHLIKRQDAISPSEIGEYIELCQECVRMMGSLVREIRSVTLENFREDIIYKNN